MQGTWVQFLVRDLTPAGCGSRVCVGGGGREPPWGCRGRQSVVPGVPWDRPCVFWWGAHPLSCFTCPVARTTAGWGPPAPSLRRGTGSHKPLTFSLRQWQLVKLLTRGIKSKQAKKSDCVKKWFKNVLCAICLATTALRGICWDRDLLLFHSRSHLGQGPQWWTLSSLQVLLSMSPSLFFLLPSVSSACPHFSSWKDIFLIFPIANKVFHLLQSPVHLT